MPKYSRHTSVVTRTFKSLFPKCAGTIKLTFCYLNHYHDYNNRSSTLRYLKETSNFGLKTYRFILPPETYNTTYDGNQGFRQPTDKYYPSQDSPYLPPGLLNLSSCRGK